uniref:Transmembrane protein 26 n=1 Tax=Caenorhabditis japonica TaxID=281687 RepID=A0A8R1DQA3_CAEJA
MDSIVSMTKSNRHHATKLKQRPNSVDASHVLISCLRAIIARGIFIVHSIVTIRQTVLISERESVWGFALLSLLIVFEGGYAIIMRAGDERKWFCTSVLLYIVATAPSIWILETKICNWRNGMDKNSLTVYDNLQNSIGIHDNSELRLQLLEQLLLVNLIVGRWLLPKGDISREQLSQILLAYLAISSDIVEFFDVFKERVVYSNSRVQKIVLSAWTLSLLQFPFVLTVSRARKMRVAITNDYEQLFARNRPRSCFKAFYDVDIWAIFLANALQDVPFLLTRLYLMTVHNLVTYTMIFFFFKNMLIILLQTYR